MTIQKEARNHAASNLARGGFLALLATVVSIGLASLLNSGGNLQISQDEMDAVQLAAGVLVGSSVLAVLAGGVLFLLNQRGD